MRLRLGHNDWVGFWFLLPSLSVAVGKYEVILGAHWLHWHAELEFDRQRGISAHITKGEK